MAKPKPHAGRAAKGVADGAGGTWVRLDLRGELAAPRWPPAGVRAEDLWQGEWSECGVALPPLRTAREVRFRAPAAATLLIDDVLLYEP